MDSQPTDEAVGVGGDFVRGGQDKTPTQKKRNSYERTVVKADTPTVTVTEGNEQYSAPWVVKSPGGTVTFSAYNDGKKRCLSAKRGSGNPRKKVSEQNKTFRRAYRKSGNRLSENEIRAEAHKRQKGDARCGPCGGNDRGGRFTREALAEKEAARKAATGQAGTFKRVSKEAARRATTR
jgi:hypothetical protein